MTLSAFALYAVIFNLIPLLTDVACRRRWRRGRWAWAEPGRSPGACATGRSPPTRGARPDPGGHGRRSPLHPPAALLPGPARLLIAASVLAGTVRGLFTLLEATAVSDYWGPAGYASLNGVFSAPLTAATAIAPTIGAALAASVGGYPALFVILAGAGALSAALALAAKPPQPGISQAPVSRPPACPRPAEPGPGRQRLARYESAA